MGQPWTDASSADRSPSCRDVRPRRRSSRRPASPPRRLDRGRRPGAGPPAPSGPAAHRVALRQPRSSAGRASPFRRCRPPPASGTCSAGRPRASRCAGRRSSAPQAPDVPRLRRPGADAGPNPRHAAIGYRPDAPPVTADPTPIVPHALPFDAARRRTDGARGRRRRRRVRRGRRGHRGGAGRGGRSVVVLEAGPFVDEPTMPPDELDAFDRLYLNHGLLTTWDGSIDDARRARPSAAARSSTG